MEPLNFRDLGKKIVPSLFVGGNCWMIQLYQDSMATVRYFGQPTLFLKFTTNLKWEKIQHELLLG